MFWDEEAQCFVDNLGMPYKLHQIQTFIKLAEIHARHHPAHLANLANKALAALPAQPKGMWFVPEDME